MGNRDATAKMRTTRPPRPRSAARCRPGWYDEVKDYDFDSPGFAGNTGHFTQNVWVESQFVGLARSEDGHYIMANFFPAGNLNTADAFAKNVFPGGADMATRTPPAKLGVTTGTEWSVDMEAALAGCPFTEFEGKIKAALAAGDTTVTITREALSIKIQLRQPLR